VARRRSKKLELWIGVFVIISAALLTWGYFWLTGQPLGERGYTVHVVLDHSGGLERGDRVDLSGVEVGVVRSVHLEAADRIVISLWLHRDLELPADSRVLVESAGFFGDVLVVLRPGTSQTLVAEGDTLTAGFETGLLDVAADVGTRVDAVLVQVQSLLADTAIDNVHGSLSSLRGTLAELEQLLRENGGEFAALSRSLRETSETLQGKIEGVEVQQAMADIEETAARMAETADILQESAESISSVVEKIDSGEGTLGLLVNDRGLYEDLRTAAQNIASLTLDIQQNPGRYLKLSIF
jgi:phospholipid/cholesterol/gamma-HCH transport system substrate-binding protein